MKQYKVTSEHIYLKSRLIFEIRELKRLQQVSCICLSEAALQNDREGIIMWYLEYRNKESEISEAEHTKKSLDKT